MKIDLHCHTTYSDGSLPVKEVIELAALRGLDVLAITDHDTFAGCEPASHFGKCCGVQVVPGVEISAADLSRKRRVHILCYFPKRPERLAGLLKEILDSRRRAMNVSLPKVIQLYPVPAEMIAARSRGSASLYKQHVMRALIDAGYTDEMFGEVFQRLFSPKGGLAYTPVQYPDVWKVLEAVHEAKGLAVLAHPSEYRSMDLLLELCEKGQIQGVETNHPRNNPEDIKTILEICERYGLAVTGGTDFHGCNTRICNPLGIYLTDEVQFDTLKKMKP